VDIDSLEVNEILAIARKEVEVDRKYDHLRERRQEFDVLHPSEQMLRCRVIVNTIEAMQELGWTVERPNEQSRKAHQ